LNSLKYFSQVFSRLMLMVACYWSV